ncbi:hypothetical protein BKA67DRAFT_663481 [Truncatella angustata]|uniref:DUF7726 domain-containing protein n=1 Tax=Truncatella angustata TaxID=152316 RepID=A0A9P8UDC1_9PEZI|nr:uncharacterized protein BKA67DRAFT_663481 [Truncatella angustata]KAH6647137.1 hypothetical protein BKA67DRAFT_663481 [Truncatella angustata]KAH8194620.1 hypothetical protein TruAng_011213 [Truncatella angustata]
MEYLDEQQVKELVLERLRVHADIKQPMIKKIRYRVTAADYFSRDDYQGGLVQEGERHYRKDGTEHTFEHVSLAKLLESAEATIGWAVKESNRTMVFERVMDDIPGRKEIPVWDKPIVTPSDTIQTPFSESRRRRKYRKTNEKMLADLAAASNLGKETIKSLALSITWSDAYGDGTCAMSLYNNVITGGRLGRDHKLEDVPNHYARDMVMDYINDTVAEEFRDKARAAVFSDLDPEEIEEYCRIRQERKHNIERKGFLRGIERGLILLVEPTEEHIRKFEEKMERIEKQHNILEDKKNGVTTWQETETILSQQEAFDAIDDKVDMKPKEKSPYTPSHHLTRSVITPGLMANDEERQIEPPHFLDRDCDQVRVMIKRFTSEGGWSVDDFRQALEVNRPRLTAFLRKRGPRDGIKTRVFQLSLEFFYRREELGLRFTRPESSVLKELDLNSGPKRRRSGKYNYAPNESPKGKRTKAQ